MHITNDIVFLGQIVGHRLVEKLRKMSQIFKESTLYGSCVLKQIFMSLCILFGNKDWPPIVGRLQSALKLYVIYTP